jgi:aminoglycoside phosphotransferase (APT) family kinase protein
MGEPTFEQAMATAERLLGRAPEHIEPFAPRIGGGDSHGFRVWCDRRPMLLKVKKSIGSPIGLRFHRIAREAGVPVPEMIAFSPRAGPLGEACAVWEWVDGVPAEWGPGEPCPYDEAEFGRILRCIHGTPCERPFGVLGDGPLASDWTFTPDLGPTSETWAGLFHCDRAARRYRDKGYLGAREADLLASLPERLSDELNAAEPRLLHMGDIMHNGNMLLDRVSGRILAVVDYVESMAGDPRWELAWVDFYFAQYPPARPGFDMARFRAAYGTDHNPDDRLGRFYLLAILVFEKLLFYSPASPRGSWAVSTLKRTIRELA